MLAEQVDKWEKELLTRGREEGRKEGSYLTAKDLLLKQIALKFGNSDKEKASDILDETQELETLQRLSQRILLQALLTSCLRVRGS